jgi:hypothetical protein
MKRYNRKLKEEEKGSFFSKYEKEIRSLAKISTNFDELSMEYKDELMKIRKIAKKENRDDIIKQVDITYKFIPDSFGLANKLMKLEDLFNK